MTNRQLPARPRPKPESEADFFVGRLAVSPAEAARALSLHRDTLYQLMNRNVIRSVKVGGRRLIAVAELRRLLGEAEAS